MGPSSGSKSRSLLGAVNHDLRPVSMAPNHDTPRSAADLAIVDQLALDVAFEPDIDALAAVWALDLKRLDHGQSFRPFSHGQAERFG